jgi:hypothetical protein
MAITRSFPYLAVPLALSAIACGALDGNPGSSPTLVTLKGQVVSAPGASPLDGDVRVAVVWQGFMPGQFNVSEDLPVQPEFPSSFQIQLDTPPPAQSMVGSSTLFGQPSSSVTPTCGIPVDGGDGCPDAGLESVDAGGAPDATSSQLAVGIVVAYLDKNGNGQLDLVPTGASSYTDEIVGVNNDLAIVYLQLGSDGALPTLPYPAGSYVAGYNLLRHVECEAIATPGDAGDGDAGACPSSGFLPFDTLYTLAVTGKPEGSTIMCQSDEAHMSSGTVNSYPSGTVPPGGWPSPGAAGLACASDGSSYTLTSCQGVAKGLCEENVCTVDQYEAPSPLPSGWPCPAGTGSR